MPMISGLHDAALDPHAWPGVLHQISAMLGVAGAAYFVRDSQSGRIDWATFTGPSVGFRPDYLGYYSSLDPFRDLLEKRGPRWTRLTESLSDSVLHRDEWYNDFVLKCGIGDIVGAQLAKVGTRTAFFGIHEGVGQTPVIPALQRGFNEALAQLSGVADVQLRLQGLGWTSAVAVRALDQLSSGVIIAEGNGRVIEMNGFAERIIKRADGLVVEEGKLSALRVFESAKLASAVSAAADVRQGESPSNRILVGRRGTRHSYIVTITPLDVPFGFHDHPVALILVVDPDERSPKESDLAEYFGLSPAESRLASHLMGGKTVAETSSVTGVAVSTLRTQLRSILRKVGVERQAELLRVLASVPSWQTVQRRGPV
jgi:DNA-binding CsgD family transcriptional regulator